MPKQSSNLKVVTKKHLARLERERRQINIIRAIAITGIVIVLLLLGFAFLQMRVVARVNGASITTRSWQERVRLERVNLYNQLSRYQFFQQNFGMDTSQQQQQILTQLNSTETIGQTVLDQMIDEVLIRQEAEKRGLTATAEEVEKLMREAYNFFPNGTPTPTLTPTEFAYPTLSSQQLTIYPPTSTATVAPTTTAEPSATPDISATATATSTPPLPTPTFVPEQATLSPTPFTEEGFQKQYTESLAEFKTYGISERTLRTVYEAQVLRQKLQEDIAKDLPHTETQVLVRHVLVDTPEEAAEAQVLLDRGTDFARVAADLSKDPGSAETGGVYDWAPASSYVPEFQDAVLTQEIGVIGEPVQTDYGYHIIQVIGREELPLTDTQFEQATQVALTDWLTAAREAATTTIYDFWKERVPTEPVLVQQ